MTKINIIKTTGILRVKKSRNGQRRLILELHTSVFKCLSRIDTSRVVEVYIDPKAVAQDYSSEKKSIKVLRKC